MELIKTRLDKWLYAVRIYKTRSVAAEACDKNRVQVSGVNAKPSRNIKTGDHIIIHMGPYKKHVKVLQLSEKRMGAPMVVNYYSDITPADEQEKLKAYKAAMASYGVRGAGRPTKKDRRDLDEFYDWREEGE